MMKKFWVIRSYALLGNHQKGHSVHQNDIQPEQEMLAARGRLNLFALQIEVFPIFALQKIFLPLIKPTTFQKMRKSEIINEIVTKTGIAQPKVVATVELMMAYIKQSMENGENVYLRGFGTFHLKERAEKTGRNIFNGTIVKIPAHVVPVFKPSKEFANKVKARVKVK